MSKNSQPVIAFVGAGNMAYSLVRGLLADGHPAANIRVADPYETALEKYAATEVATFLDNNVAIADADAIVLAVKPQVAGAVTEALSLKPEQLLISIAAGIALKSLSSWTTASQPLIRCMPNTPALLGAGMTALFANSFCTSDQRDTASYVLNAAGQTLWVDQEPALDAVTAVSGSGPAYFFRLMEAMIDAGTALGLSRSQANALTLQTAYGAALMAMQTDDDPATLRENVTSPGGTTAAALEVMAEAGIGDIVEQALKAANDRSISLAEEFGK